MGLSRTVSEINGDFSRKSQDFPIPVYLTLAMKGFPLEFIISTWSRKNSNDGATVRQRSLMITLAVWVQYTNVMDRRGTPGDSKDSAYIVKPITCSS